MMPDYTRERQLTIGGVSECIDGMGIGGNGSDVNLGQFGSCCSCLSHSGDDGMGWRSSGDEANEGRPIMWLIGIYIIGQIVIGAVKLVAALVAFAWGALFEAWRECRDGKVHDLT